MGVNGLWAVVQPCARPTNLATLNRKRLAVDASIWIYQFLKAVRDKEGNALRNSHVVGFFRRICKLLWFGIQPVFVFDGGAPALKRATIQSRKRRREGRRDDAVRTAGKLLAVQMQRIAEEEEDKRRRDQDRGVSAREEEQQQEEIPNANDIVYADEMGMSQKERQRTRRFFKQDAYHLPELDGGIAAMGKSDDPRIMSVDELEEYARQFHSGEDINLYDFSKIDFDGDFFKSLPPPDRYNILNAARLRSRLRLGYSKDQLDDMFPDRMAFSRFQIERVKERNHLTQRLMYEVGMNGTDLTIGGNVSRVAGEKDREYILVKNEGVEGGWALGVVSKEKDIGEEHKPIDVDAIQVQYQSRDDDVLDDEEDEFEDVPIEGLNRLPKPSRFNNTISGVAAGDQPQRPEFVQYNVPGTVEKQTDPDEDSLFVGGNAKASEELMDESTNDRIHPEEVDDINQAIALSLRNQHGVGIESDPEEDLEDVPIDEPVWDQKAVEAPRPIGGSGKWTGSAIAHIVNNRANAAVPKPQEKPADDSDSEEDMQAVMARARKQQPRKPAPVVENKKNPFDGPLPFPKLDWGSSIFAKKNTPRSKGEGANAEDDEGIAEGNEEDNGAGGFERLDDDAPKPLPPWLADDTDIRESLKKQQDVEREINAEDRMEAEAEEQQRRREMKHQTIEIDSSEDGSDVEILDVPPSPKAREAVGEMACAVEQSNEAEQSELDRTASSALETEQESVVTQRNESPPSAKSSPEPTFEDVPVLGDTEAMSASTIEPPATRESPELEFEDVPFETSHPTAAATSVQLEVSGGAAPGATKGTGVDEEDELFADVEYDEFSDPGDEELLAQMAEEADEHARFASELNKKSAQQNKEDYEKELRQLRNQQKKDRRDADEVTQVMITECQALLRLFGIPYITAPMEAEAQCAELVSLGLVDGIVTDDSDTFLFGGTRVYKNMFNSNKFVECYLGQDLEKELSLSREQLISLAQLLGSDYTDGLPGVGPVTAVEILSEFPGKSGLENFKAWWTDVQSTSRPKEADASSPFRKKFRKSQGTKLFLPPSFPSAAVYDAYLHPEVDDTPEPFQWGVPDLEGLRRFLMATIGWGKERTDEVLVPVIKDMNKRDREGTQSNITRFFEGGVGVGAKEAFAPRQQPGQRSSRMAAAVDKLRANVTGEKTGGAGGARDRNEAARRKRPRRGVSDEDDEANGGDDGGNDNNEDDDSPSATRTNNDGLNGKGRRAKGKRARAL